MALQRFRTSSVLVYRAQWHHFLDWLTARGRTLRSTEPALIDEFAATIDVKRQQRARYLRIMERVFDDMSGQSQALGNPARTVTRSIDAPWTDTASNAPTGFLTPAERALLWQALTQTETAAGQPLPWRDLRDRAMAAMLLGAGLKLNELESMELAQLRLGWPDSRVVVSPTKGTVAASWTIEQETDQRGGVIWIPRTDAAERTYTVQRNAAHHATAMTDPAEAADIAAERTRPGDVSATGNTDEIGGGRSPTVDSHRAVPFPAHAAVILLRWLQARTENDVEGELVFPAGRSGAKMHKATALRAIDALVEASGLRALHHGRISPQTLRNAYAAALFAAGQTDEQVAANLGMIKVLSARRLRAAWDLYRAEPSAIANGEGALMARPARRRDRA
jgi:integrase